MNNYIPFKPIKGQAFNFNTGLFNDMLAHTISDVCMNSDASKLVVSIHDTYNYGALFISTDNGITFTELTQPVSSYRCYRRLACSDDFSTIMVAVENASTGTIWISNDLGVTWTDSGLTKQFFISVDCDSDASNIIAGSNYRLYTSSDSGANWVERQPAGVVTRKWCGVASDNDGSNLIACVNHTTLGRLYTSSDSGANWVERQPAGDVAREWYSVASNSDGSILYACISSSTNGRIYKSIDSGANWVELQPEGDINKSWSFISCSSNGSVVIVSSSFLTYRSENGGLTWSLINNGVYASVNRLNNDGSVVATCSNSTGYGYFHLSFDSGSTFKRYYRILKGLWKDGVEVYPSKTSEIINHELDRLTYNFTADEMNADNISLEVYSEKPAEYYRTEQFIINTQEPELISAPTKTSSLEDKITAIFQYLFGKRTVTASAETLYKDNGTDVLATNTISDDSTTVTKGKIS